MAEYPKLDDLFKFTPSAAPGAPATFVHSTRQMRTMTVTLTELESLSNWNGNAIQASSFASALGSFGLAIWLEAAVTEGNELSLIGSVLTWALAPLSIVLAIGFALSAWRNLRSRNAVLTRIRNESGDED